jgi:hypothetical protein
MGWRELEMTMTIKTTKGRGFTDYLSFVPHAMDDPSAQEAAMEVFSEAVQKAVKGTKELAKYCENGNVENHVVLELPGSMFKPRAMKTAVREARKALAQMFPPRVMAELVVENLALTADGKVVPEKP